MVTELTEDILGEIIETNGKVIVQFSASWCGNCRIMKPKFKKLSKDNEEMTFVIIDAEKNPNSRKLAKVDNLPTFATFKNGLLINQVQTNKFELLKTLVDEIAAD